MIGKKKKKEKNTQPKEYNLIAIGLSIIVVIALVITAIFMLKNRKPAEEEKPKESEEVVEKEPEVKPAAKEILEQYVKEKAYEDELEQYVETDGVAEIHNFVIPFRDFYHKKVEYCIMDLNDDEMEELLIQIDLEADFYYTYVFAVEDETVRYVDAVFHYEKTKYSAKERSLVYAPHYNNPGALNTYTFDRISNMQAIEAFDLTVDGDIYQKHESDNVTEITEEEFEEYLADAKDVEWIENGTIELERMKAESVEFAAPTFIVDVPKGWTAQMEYYLFGGMKRETEVPVLALYKGKADKSNPYILISAIEVTGIGGMVNWGVVDTVEKKNIGVYESWISQYGLPPFTVRSFIIDENEISEEDKYYNYTFRPEMSADAQYLFDAVLKDQLTVDSAEMCFIMDSFRLNPIGMYITHGYHERFDAPSLQANKQDPIGFEGENTYYVYEIKEVDGITWYRTGLYTWIADGQGQIGTYESVG